MGIDFRPNMYRTPGYTSADDGMKTKESGGEGQVDGSSAPSQGNMTYGTVTRSVFKMVELPSLPPKSGATPHEIQAYYESLMSKLARVRGDATGGKSIMFDIYAMMDMIQEVAQRMRNVMRDLRKVENTTIYANIKAQAEIQREAAMVGLVAGAVMSGIQIAVVTIGAGYQLKAAAGSKGGNSAGMLKTAENVEHISGNLGKPAASNARLSSFDKVLTPEQRASVTQNYDNVGKLTPKEMGERAALETKLKTAADGGSDIERGKAALDLVKFDQKHGIVLNKQGQPVKTVTPEMRNEAIAKDVAVAKDSYLKAQSRLDGAQKIVDKGGQLPEGVTLDQLKSDVKLAGQKYEYAVAKQVDVANGTKMNPMEMRELKSEISTDAGELRQRADLGSAQQGPPDGSRFMIKGMIIQQIGMSIGQFLQQVAGSISQIISSKQTELQAEQKLTEEQFDQIKDLFQLQQGVIQKSIDIFSAVIQKESSVLEQIFQHI